MPNKMKADEVAAELCKALGVAPHDSLGDKSRQQALAEWFVMMGLAEKSEAPKTKGGDK